MDADRLSNAAKGVLVVEDDDALARLLEAALLTRGYEVLRLSDGEGAVEAAEQGSFSLILLDLGIPKLNGFQVCQRIRRNSNVPIIILSGKSTVADKSAALEMGADDYVTKPFSLDELLARIKALLRRSEGQTASQVQGFLRCGNLVLDLETRKVVRDGQAIGVTPIEFDLLRILASNPDRVVTYGDLLLKVWGQEYASERGYLRVHMSHMRQKIEQDPTNPQYIHTVTRVGYRLSWSP
ncbi:MAG: response regulator transcription factor [Chloroflexi bacterium]|nr:response regulator transcription factor [Chloroflexota bacterium]